VEGSNVAGNEPVISPDQRKPTDYKWARRGALATIVILIAMMFPLPKEGYTELLWVGGTAALIALALIADWVMRKNGLKS
jgi:hypothetical protein